MLKFPEIEGLHQIVKMLDKYPYMSPDKPVEYKGKIKLHGTNGGVAIYPDGRVIAQSRELELVDGADNCGFAKWVEAKKDEFLTIRDNVQITIFGEWCGKGIQDGCAIHQVDKCFVVFMIQYGDNETGQCYVEPYILEDILEEISNVKVLPWYEPATITLDYSNKEQLRKQADVISALILEVEKCDPWVKQTFGVEGIGEGIVYYPVSLPIQREGFTRMMFKAKGDKHKVKKEKQAVVVDVEVLKSVNAFVDAFVTENRCKQGLNVACGDVLDRKLTGQFLKWLNQDVEKESKVELEAANLKWDDVKQAVQKAAQKWWLEKTGKI